MIENPNQTQIKTILRPKLAVTEAILRYKLSLFHFLFSSSQQQIKISMKKYLIVLNIPRNNVNVK